MMFAMLLLTLDHAVFISTLCCVTIAQFFSIFVHKHSRKYLPLFPWACWNYYRSLVVWAVHCLLLSNSNFPFPPDPIPMYTTIGIYIYILYFFSVSTHSTFVYWIETFSFNTKWNAYSNFFCWFLLQMKRVKR